MTGSLRFTTTRASLCFPLLPIQPSRARYEGIEVLGKRHLEIQIRSEMGCLNASLTAWSITRSGSNGISAKGLYP